MNHLVFATSLGFAALGWNDRGVARFALPEETHAQAARNAARWSGSKTVADETDVPRGVAKALELVRRYANAEAVSFSEVALDLDGMDAFRRAIYAAAGRLGYGVTTTYGALAEDAGFPGMAREAGQALGSNPIPLIIPCHRIVAAGGKIGGFSAPGGTRTKQKLLIHEGALFTGKAEEQRSFDF